MCDGNYTMTGVVTSQLSEKEARGLLAENAPGARRTTALSDAFRAFEGRSFISFSELMTCLGVPKEAFKGASVPLRNGRKASMTDPQVGWGMDGFGYYVTTYVPLGMGERRGGATWDPH